MRVKVVLQRQDLFAHEAARGIDDQFLFFGEFEIQECLRQERTEDLGLRT